MLRKEPLPLPLVMYYRTYRTTKINASQEPSDHFFHPILEAYNNSIESNNYPFIDFEKWFIQQENLENEEIKKRKDFTFELPVLKAMRTVISDFLSFFYDEPNLKIEVTRKTQEDSDFPIVHRGNSIVDIEESKYLVFLCKLS